MKYYTCGNCGHDQAAGDDLKELGFIWLDDSTSKITCSNCKTATLQRIYGVDHAGQIVAGEFLVILTKNKIRKGKK